MNWLLVGIGGMFGSILRYGLSTWVAQLFSRALLPYGLMTVNILGCLLIGALAALMQSKHGLRPELVLLLMVGFLGGFTTFSSFGLETFTLLRDQHIYAALMDVLIQVVVGTLAVGAGFWCVLRLA
jgi:CrcB protein